ncbi:MAG: ATP-dependent Clp protease adaptor ClpS [Breznakibacter sp.]|nr:ATP-dependent Clp protease adaptor ClpS [Breznakibacter sp.]
MLVSKKNSEFEISKETSSDNWVLVLHNDDVNSFDYVIEQLITFCDHDSVQAEQCAMITHYNGKCGVLIGAFETLELVKNLLVERSLSVTIEGRSN